MASLRLAPIVRAKASASRTSYTSVRRAHDLTVLSQPTASTPTRPIIKYGPPTGGRSAVSGHTVTVFGCTGFLGRYLVHKLAKVGTQVIVPYRDEDEKRHLKVMGDLGQIVPLEWDARNPDQIHECLRYSDTVYNLVGRDWETRNFSYNDVNVKTASLIAQVAAEANVPRMIHVSHLNASPNSPSELYRTKYAGERAVREAFPEATIVRPGPLFGGEDWLLNAAAQWPILFKLNHGQTKILPVHVLDVAEALSLMLTAPVTSVASTFALPGPAVHTYQSILELISAMTLKPTSTALTVPKPLAKLFATLVNRGLWWPTVSPDEIERRYIDDAGAQLLAESNEQGPSGWASANQSSAQTGVDGEPVKSWGQLAMTPDHIEEHAIKYVRRYRSAANFDIPVELGHYKPQKQYHVLP
ncbi:Protein-lysine N-methyltransferase efm5 [Cryptotrichosporon argae]